MQISGYSLVVFAMPIPKNIDMTITSTVNPTAIAIRTARDRRYRAYTRSCSMTEQRLVIESKEMKRVLR